MWKTVCVVLTVVIIAHTEAAKNTPCTSDSECDQGECCQILSEFQVVSKRQIKANTGTCQLYTKQGGSCYPLDKMNGYCSCEPGTQCTHHPYPTAATLLTPAKRKILPGIYDCQPPQ